MVTEGKPLVAELGYFVLRILFSRFDTEVVDLYKNTMP